MSNKKKKVRVELRKNRTKPPRENDLTRAYQEDADRADDTHASERVRAKGDLSRYRTVVQDNDDAVPGMPSVDAEACIRGRVIRVHGLASVVETDDGRVFRCAVRRLLKSLVTDERNVITTGDIVWIRPAVQGQEETGRQEAEENGNEEEPDSTQDSSQALPSGPVPEGMIERVEPRRGVLTRASR